MTRAAEPWAWCSERGIASLALEKEPAKGMARAKGAWGEEWGGWDPRKVVQPSSQVSEMMEL